MKLLALLVHRGRTNNFPRGNFCSTVFFVTSKERDITVLKDPNLTRLFSLILHLIYHRSFFDPGLQRACCAGPVVLLLVVLLVELPALTAPDVLPVNAVFVSVHHPAEASPRCR